MAQSFAAGEKEIWESTIEGRVAVEVMNSQGRPQTLSIKGKGSRLRLVGSERTVIEEQVRERQNNPFRNGMLIQVGGPVDPEAEPSADELADEDLAGLFELKGGDFAEAVQALSEVNVRRLKAMVKAHDATSSQVEFIDGYIAQQWPIGADTPSNAEARGDRTVTV